MLFDIQIHTEWFRVYDERYLSKEKILAVGFQPPWHTASGSQLPHPGRRQVPVPGLGRAPEPLLSSPIFLLLCALGVTADPWDVTFWHMRLRGSRGAGVGASAWLSQPGTCQTKFHSWLGVELGPGTDLDESDLLKSNGNVCPAGDYPTGSALQQVSGLGQRLRRQGWVGGKWRCFILLFLIFKFVAARVRWHLSRLYSCKSAILLYFESPTCMKTTNCHRGFFPQWWLTAPSLTQQQERGLAGEEECLVLMWVLNK